MARELGTVDPRQAQELFLALARSPETGSGGSDAVFPAILADVPEGWRGVMDLATDTRAPAEARRSAFFWLSQSSDPRVPAFFRDMILGGHGG